MVRLSSRAHGGASSRRIRGQSTYPWERLIASSLTEVVVRVRGECELKTWGPRRDTNKESTKVKGSVRKHFYPGSLPKDG